MNKITFYKMCINNAKNYIIHHDAYDENKIDAFEFSEAFSVIFVKAKEEILFDLIKD